MTVALLAHNDSAHVEELLSAWAGRLDGMGRDYQLLLVDDGSADDTAGRADALREKFPRLEVLRHESPRGVGAALRTALEAAKRPLFFYTLCDPRYRPDDLPRLLQTIDPVHLVSGYRAGRPVPAAWRVLGAVVRVFCRVVFSAAPAPLPGWLGRQGHAARLLARVLFGVRNRDVLCPYRLMRRDIFGASRSSRTGRSSTSKSWPRPISSAASLPRTCRWATQAGRSWRKPATGRARGFSRTAGVCSTARTSARPSCRPPRRRRHEPAVHGPG